jgi:protein-tyrosine phosphatase
LYKLINSPWAGADPEYISQFGDKRRILIHCAAGIHRTGTITYSLLRIDGKSPTIAYDNLKLLRTATYEGVKNWRIYLAETKILPEILPATSP